MNFITDNLIPVTIGNIIGGGLLVGLTLAMLCSKPLATNIATGNTMIIALSIRLRPE
jgi:hypothetical protein